MKVYLCGVVRNVHGLSCQLPSSDSLPEVRATGVQMKHAFLGFNTVGNIWDFNAEMFLSLNVIKVLTMAMTKNTWMILMFLSS